MVASAFMVLLVVIIYKQVGSEQYTYDAKSKMEYVLYVTVYFDKFFQAPRDRKTTFVLVKKKSRLPDRKVKYSYVLNDNIRA